MISIDCKKEFDSVSHCILCRKLIDLECPEQLYGVIASFLDNRTISVRARDEFSRSIPLTCGEPQEAVLSPVRFSICTADVVGENNRQATVAAYADDIAIYSSSMQGCKHAIQNMH
nr:uncharacterized protein LOC106691760 [Halyomorpha halys]